MKGLDRIMAVLGLALVMSIIMIQFVDAIPEADIYMFRASARAIMKFDDYVNITDVRFVNLKTFHNDSAYYYMVIRANPGDVAPYDDFYLRFQCQGDALSTELHTTDYTSWTESGMISFKRQFNNPYIEQYDGVPIDAQSAWCQIYSADDLIVNGNTGYTKFYVEMVPLLYQRVQTIEDYCGEEERVELVDNIQFGIQSVLQNNIDFLSVNWVIFQIIAMIAVVLGIPVMLFMLIRWAMWRIAGIRIFGVDNNV